MLELSKRPEPRGETDGWERYPADRYRIADTLLADLEAASHRVAEIDSHIKEHINQALKLILDSDADGQP